MALKPIKSKILPKINSGPMVRIWELVKELNTFSTKLSVSDWKREGWFFNRLISCSAIFLSSSILWRSAPQPMVLTTLYLPLALLIIWILTLPELFFFSLINIENNLGHPKIDKYFDTSLIYSCLDWVSRKYAEDKNIIEQLSLCSIVLNILTTGINDCKFTKQFGLFCKYNSYDMHDCKLIIRKCYCDYMKPGEAIVRQRRLFFAISFNDFHSSRICLK